MNEFFDTTAEVATCFFNFETNYRSSVSPFGLRVGDRLTGRPLNLDISQEPMRLGLIGNRTKLLIGSSGSGKSVFCATMLEAYIRQGAHAVVADIGHSYRNLCTLLDGIYLTYSKENPLRFNPFVLEDGFDTEKMESIKALLLALWKKDY